MTDSTRLRSQIDEFLSALAVERGLSPNTISAYRRDLDGYAGFLDGRSPDPAAIDGYLASLHDQGRSSSTVARRLAAVRGFHKFLVAEGAAQKIQRGSLRHHDVVRLSRKRWPSTKRSDWSKHRQLTNRWEDATGRSLRRCMERVPG